jgi:hypothetical protein
MKLERERERGKEKLALIMCGVVKPNNLYPSISLGWQKCLLDPTL